jgi:serine/threonine-protein kinase PknG
MTSCNRPGCDGHLLPTGFCDTCKRRPLPPAQADQAMPSRRGSSTMRRLSAGSWRAGDLVSLPDLDLGDPTTLVLTAAELAEDKRFCAECGAPVGRRYRDRPAREDGFCEDCGTRYSFSLKLATGDVVNGRYRVYGPLARGGLGWVYLAHDLNLDQLVVLKGLLNTADRRAKELIANERIALTSLDHPNVVRIHDFAQHPDPVTGKPIDYIVMEYVQGPALSELKSGSPWQVGHGPMTPELVIAYGLEILAALDYLHSVGLLYCDMKPNNVIRGRDRIKVIDLGAVRAIGDSDTESIGTEGFRVSKDEVATHGLTVRSDLHTVGKTLEVLYQVTEDAITDRPKPGPISLGLRSLRHVYQRALDDYHRRYASAGEMAEQLTGVLREIVALRGGAVRVRPSTVFVEPTVLLDAGLGSVPPLSYWLDHGTEHDEPPLHVGPPDPMTIALGLPAPLVWANDPGASFLATLTATEPEQVLDSLRRSATRTSVEIPLRACRALIELREFDTARTQLSAAESLLAGTDWRILWYRGLIELAADDVAAAEAEFTEVYRDLPGEDPPKLALGLCAEIDGRPLEAKSFYQAVWLRERLAASAAFGLARIEAASNRQREAVRELDGISHASRYAQEARIAAIRVLCGRPAVEADRPPDPAALRDAVTRLTQLSTLDDGERDGPARIRLTALVRAAAVRHAEPRGGLTGVDGGMVLGSAKTTRQLRGLLEESLRLLADQAHTQDEHDVLVDHANSVRPRTLL